MARQRALGMAAMLSYGLLLAACANRDASIAPSAASRPSPARNEIYLVVQRGQTLDAVAERFRVSKADIIALNDLKPPYRLKSGAVLKLPAAAAEANPETQTEEEAAPAPRPPRAATTATATAPPATAPAQARQPARPKTSEKPKPSPSRVIPLD